MDKPDCIPKGPKEFESLLLAAKLSERESQAVRSVVFGMTAVEAAPLIGVSSSTVGSYRQRAYRKLGVLDKQGFLCLPSVVSWQEGLSASSVIVDAAHPDSNPLENSQLQQLEVIKETKGHGPLFARCVLASFLIVTSIFVVRLFFDGRDAFLPEPSGIISSSYGDIPDVVGMRADAAAAALAENGVYPRFEPCAESGKPGEVVSLVSIASNDDIELGQSSFSWGNGCTAVYDSHGSWRATALLKVAV